MSIVGILGALFASVGFIVKFIKSFLIKYATFAVILSIQFTITAATILFVLAFYTFTITSFISLYNSFISIVDYAFVDNASSFQCLYGFLNCSGILPALSNGTSLFFVALGTIMLFHLTRFTYGALKAIKDEIFKLGLLLGQALS